MEPLCIARQQSKMTKRSVLLRKKLELEPTYFFNWSFCSIYYMFEVRVTKASFRSYPTDLYMSLAGAESQITRCTSHFSLIIQVASSGGVNISLLLGKSTLFNDSYTVMAQW